MTAIFQFIGRNPVLCTIAMVLFLPWSLYQGSQVITDASVDGLIIEDEEQIASDLNIRHAGNIPQPFATTG